jgi:integrase
MVRQSARVLEPVDVRKLLRHAGRQRHGIRNKAIILLSFKAGLRACEIAGLDWAMILLPSGRLAPIISISKSIAKNGSARQIPLHPELKRELVRLYVEQGKPVTGPVIRSERGSYFRPRAIVNWFSNIYSALGYHGCSSHSGRRTFITRSARLLHRSGGSLRDIQELAGHRALATTERYIAGDRQSQRRLIKLI